MKLISGTQIFKSDLSDSLSKAIEACESVAAAGYECRELQLSVDSAIEALKEIEINGAEWYLNNHKDNTEVIGYLGMSVESLTGFIAEEGVKEMAVKAWEKIKEFFKKLWGYIVRVYENITERITDSKIDELERNLRSVTDDKIKGVTPNRKIVSFKTIDEMFVKCKDIEKKYGEYSKLLNKHLKNVEDAVNHHSKDKETQIKEDSDKLKKMFSEIKAISDDMKQLKESDDDASENKSLFKLGYTALKIPRIFFILRHVKSSIKDIKRTEEQIKILRERIIRSEVSAGRENLDEPANDVDDVIDQQIAGGIRRGETAAAIAGIGIATAATIGPTVIGAALIVSGAVYLLYSTVVTAIGVWWKCVDASGAEKIMSNMKKENPLAYN